MGQVYLVQNNKHIKIGYSKNAKNRLRELTKTPYENVLIAYKDDVDYSFESMLHKKYKDYRIRGEWFSLGVEDVSQLINDYNFIKENEFIGVQKSKKRINTREMYSKFVEDLEQEIKSLKKELEQKEKERRLYYGLAEYHLAENRKLKKEVLLLKNGYVDDDTVQSAYMML